MVIPVLKLNITKTHNDFRPVALTSIVMKVREKLVRSEILRKTEHLLDPLQFAYRLRRGVGDATVTLLNLLFKHLDNNGSYAILLFIDTSVYSIFM